MSISRGGWQHRYWSDGTHLLVSFGPDHVPDLEYSGFMTRVRNQRPEQSCVDAWRESRDDVVLIDGIACESKAKAVEPGP